MLILAESHGRPATGTRDPASQSSALPDTPGVLRNVGSPPAISGLLLLQVTSMARVTSRERPSKAVPALR